MTYEIIQIFFDAAQTDQLDPAFVPLDNTDNARPDLQEWYLWNREFLRIAETGIEHWGFVSWRFKEKTNLTGAQVRAWIDANPGYDVYLINPAIINEAVFMNGWEQGDYYHPGLSDIANDFLTRAGYEDPAVKEIFMDRTRMGFATYVIGNRKFWEGYLTLTRRIFAEADKDADFKQAVFAEGAARYSRDGKLGMFPFLNERLVGTYMELEGLKVLPYVYDDSTLADKYKPYWPQIKEMSDLKVAINAADDIEELYSRWLSLRSDFLAKNPGVLNLE